MLSFIIAIVAFSLITLTGFAFGETTSAGATTGSYVAIPEAVRDFYSREVLFQAQPRLRFLQFAKVKRDLQAIRGKSIVFVKYGNLKGGGSLEETDVLTPEAMSTSEIVVPVKEQGNSTQVTEYLLRTSLLDVLGDASKLLANNMAIVLDGQFRDTVLKTTNVVYGNGKKSLATVTATDYFNTTTVKDAVETLATNNAPRINGDYYDYGTEMLPCRFLRLRFLRMVEAAVACCADDARLRALVTDDPLFREEYPLLKAGF